MNASPSLLLPEQTRLVHIGPQKTGSTALQVAMSAVRAQLLEHGVHYAGAGHRPREAGWAMLGIGRPVGREMPGIEHWETLVREVEDAGELRVCISNEDFAKAQPDKADRVVDELGGDRVHVVAVARRLDRLLPSQWQERVKARQTMSYERWLEVVLGPPSDTFEWRNLWTPHDLEGMVARWTRRVGPERFTLIVGNDADHSLLPRTFEQMLGLPEGLIDTSAGQGNRSLTMTETELVRQVNRSFSANEWGPDAYLTMVQAGAVHRLKSAAKVADDGPIPPLPAWAAERVAEISAKRAERARELGVRLVGDVDDLLAPVGEPDKAVPVVEVVPIEVAARAVEGAIAGALRREKRDARRRRVRRRTAPDRGGKRPAAARRTVQETSSRELLGAVWRRALGRVTRRRGGKQS